MQSSSKPSFYRPSSSLIELDLPILNIGAAYAAEEKDDEDHSTKPSFSRILSQDMMAKAVADVDDKAVYKLGFARKSILSALPFTHSAVAFLDTTAKDQAKWLICGRQTPYFLKPNTKEANEYRGGILNLLHNFTSSKIDNEKKYDFFRDQKFEAEMSDVTLSGKEVKEIISMTDTTICKDRMFDLVRSNCYSASVSVLANAIKVISRRPEASITDKTNNDKNITRVYTLILSANKDNFSIGVGNQPLVQENLENINDILNDRGIKKPADSKPKSPRPE